VADANDRRILVCAGSDCRRHIAYEPLCAALADAGVRVERVKCIDLCHPPVAIITSDDERPVIVERVRSAKQHRDLVRVAVSGDGLTKRLRALRATGKPLTKARRSFTKQQR